MKHAAMLMAVMALAVPASAGSIDITYNFNGVGTVVDATDTTLTLDALATGSILSGNPAWNASSNPVTYTDESVLDLITGALNGDFTISFAGGSTPTGHVFEDNSAILADPAQTGPFTQLLTFTGGTGQFAGPTGSATGKGFVGTSDFTVSGTGTVNASAVPEPGSFTLLLAGVTLVVGVRRLPARGIAAVASLLALASAAVAVEPGLPSRTAIGAAVGRAIGSKNPKPELRNPDTLANAFLGPRERALITDFPAGILDLDFAAAMQRYPNPAFVTAMFVRTKFFDRMLTEALDRKVAQVVILGAGLDSRGYRFKDQLRGVKFFEVDYGPTQEYKKQRVKDIFGELPKHIRYVPVDFIKDDLLTRLDKSGYRQDETALFIWEAVSFYLPESSVKNTLHFVRDHAAPGSTIVFDYTLSRNPDVANPDSRYARIGEPFLFGFPDTGAADSCVTRGWR